MLDEKIVELYWQRDETAIRETEQKYGRYLLTVAQNILSDAQDSEESVGDTYLAAWNSLPPHRPERLAAYLAKLTRRISIDCFRRRSRKKRQPSEYELSLDELAECLPGGPAPEAELDVRLLAEAIGAYLRGVPAEARTTFIGRYYFLDPLRTVAACCGMSESRAKSLLHRTRCGLRAYLEQEGFQL